MTAQTKGRIRHVALSVKDPWETAEFYKQAVGLQEVTELDGPLAEGVFLTDGVVNLAILHFKSDEASQGTGVDYVGIHRTAMRSSTPTSTASSSTSPRTAGPVRRRTRDRQTTLRMGTHSAGWRSSTRAARGPRRSSRRCVAKSTPRQPSDAPAQITGANKKGRPKSRTSRYRGSV